MDGLRAWERHQGHRIT